MPDDEANCSATLRRCHPSNAQREHTVSQTTNSDENISSNIDAHRFSLEATALERIALLTDRWRNICDSEHSEPEWAEFLATAALYDRGAVGLYSKEFRDALPGKKVLDFGSGRGINAVAMASLGADVTAVDISPESALIANFLAERYGLQDKLTGRAGDIREMEFEPQSFDLIVGQSILHHLVHDLEWEIMEKLTTLVKPDGTTIFVELAHNWPLLQQAAKLVWLPHSPSILQKKAYAKSLALNAHPERDNSMRHFEELGRKFYHEVEVVPFAGLERLACLLPGVRSSAKLRRAALEMERFLPASLANRLAAAQTMTFRRPRIPHLPR